MNEARFYTPADEGVKCLLCPHHCRIREGGRGLCRSRECRDGKLYALSYGRPCALAIDPVEKKPLNHFMPGTRCLSLSCTGCNLSCRWCQNSDISQAGPEEAESDEWSPEEIVDAALRRGLPSIAFTYTEPFTWWEYMYDIAAFAHDRDLKNILVSAGYVEREPLEELLPYLDAANIDIKAMEGRPRLRAASTISSGDHSSDSASSGPAWEMSLFWHHRQERLQPVQLRERHRVPGMKWLRGFFSMGSMARAQGLP